MSGVETGNPNLYHASVASLRTGDKLNEANLRAPLIHLADNDAFLYGLVGPAGAGTKRLFKVANVTELQALIGLAEGDMVRVADQGIYTYHTSDGGQSTLAPKRYLITAGGIARATWHDATNTANGLAGLGTDARVPNANLRGQLVATYNFPNQHPTTLAYTGNGNMNVVASSSVTLSNLEDGDLIQIVASFYVTNHAAGTWVEYAINATTMADIDLNINVAGQLIAGVTGTSVSSVNTKALSGGLVVQSAYLTGGQMKLRQSIAAVTGGNGVFAFLGTPNIYHFRKP